MAYEGQGESLIDYQHCRYKRSKILFRGPKRHAKSGFVAFVGGTETYGKYVENPFVDLVERDLNIPCLNLGAMNAGIDLFLTEDTISEICEDASHVIIQLMGAQNMSNRFYSVHSRRNDRFLSASTLLKTIYREVDFTEFAFTRHMLGTLKNVSPEKFSTVEAELKTAWSARMELYLSRIKKPKKILLWVSDRAPEMRGSPSSFGGDPLFIDREMIEKLRPFADDIIEVSVPRAMVRRTKGMKFPDLEENAASQIIGPDVHELVAEHIKIVLQKKKPAS